MTTSDNETASNQPTGGASAVEFATRMRVHVALPVKDLAASVAYYTVLLGREPSKLRDGYAKYEVAEPPVNLTLNEVQGEIAHNPAQHFGIQVKHSDEVVAYHGKLRAAGFATMDERGATCCFAVQDKVWSVDPDGHRWEVFVVLDDTAEVHSTPSTAGVPGPAALAGVLAPGRPEGCCP